MAESSISMKFTAQTADAQRRIAELEKEVAKLNQEVKQSGSASASASSGMEGMGAKASTAAIAIAAAAAAIKALVSAASECIDAYRQQEIAETRLRAVMIATNNQIGASTKDMLELASATQQATRFGDEAIIEAEKLLIATQSLDKEGLQRAIAASADLAEAMGTDITSAAQTMAYALQDPVAGLTRLRRQGIAFTDEEIAQVKALQDANDQLGAQAIILEKVESKYQGVAKALGDTPTGTLDKIKNVWGDIKEGMGKGLLDAINPALDRLYKRLEDISAWINSMSTGTDSEILRTIQKSKGTGESPDLSGYTTAQLISALDKSEQQTRTLQDSTNSLTKAASRFFPDLQKTAGAEYFYDWGMISRELIARGYTSVEDARKGVLGYSGETGSTVWSEGSAAEEGPAISSFLSKNASSSKLYQNAQYQAIIDQAENYLKLINEYGGVVEEDGERAILKLLGLPEGTTISDVRDMASQLSEIIETTKEKQAKLFETPEEVPDWLPTDYLAAYQTSVEHLTTEIALLDSQIEDTTDPATLEYLKAIREGLQEEYDDLVTVAEGVDELSQYIQNNTSLSATAQAAHLDALIAEAEAWKQAEDAGENELKILDEIIAKLKEQRSELEETGETWQQQAKKAVEEWSPVVGKFQDMTGAITGFMTQMWNSQADELERALERDKAAGDMSEQEEADRLKTIDDLRRKSFEAEKANSISNAVINGALAITQCLTEGIQGYIMAGLISATTAVQVATIANQQYTPMAKGGIVTQATPIIAGEAGPEAIIPLSGGRAQQYLGNGGVVINITIEGNADEEVVFHAIERAQRTGYLPNWQYV